MRARSIQRIAGAEVLGSRVSGCVRDAVDRLLAVLTLGAGMSWRIALGIGGCLAGPIEATAQPARSYHYTLEYALSPADSPQVQRKQAAVCIQMEPSRCRVMLSRADDGGYQQGALTVEVARAMAPHVLEKFAGIVDDVDGQARLRELEVTEGSAAAKASGTATIAVTYVGIPGFAEQTGEALRAFGPGVKAGMISTIFLLPVLAPWLATAGLIAWGVRTARRRRRRQPA
jgi:hypothetical protein